MPLFRKAQRVDEVAVAVAVVEEKATATVARAQQSRRTIPTIAVVTGGRARAAMQLRALLEINPLLKCKALQGPWVGSLI